MPLSLISHFKDTHQTESQAGAETKKIETINEIHRYGLGWRKLLLTCHLHVHYLPFYYFLLFLVFFSVFRRNKVFLFVLTQSRSWPLSHPCRVLLVGDKYERRVTPELLRLADQKSVPQNAILKVFNLTTKLPAATFLIAFSCSSTFNSRSFLKAIYINLFLRCAITNSKSATATAAKMARFCELDDLWLAVSTWWLEAIACWMHFCFIPIVGPSTSFSSPPPIAWSPASSSGTRSSASRGELRFFVVLRGVL